MVGCEYPTLVEAVIAGPIERKTCRLRDLLYSANNSRLSTALFLTFDINPVFEKMFLRKCLGLKE